MRSVRQSADGFVDDGEALSGCGELGFLGRKVVDDWSMTLIRSL